MTISKYLAALLLVAGISPALAADFEPDRRVELVVHTGPGGGGDLMARALQTMFEQEGLLPLGTEVVNKPGPTGAAAMGYMAQKGGDANVLGIFTSTWIIDPVLNAEAPITWKALTPVAGLLTEPSIALVRTDSPYKDFNDFLADAKARPGELIQAGGAFGTVTMWKLQLEKHSDTSWVFVPYPTGGERVAELLGGHADLLLLEVQEAAKYIEAGTMRGLVVVDADTRLASFPDIPTMDDLGIDIENVSQIRGIMAPPGISPEATAFWDETFAKLVASQSWKDYIAKNQMVSSLRASADLNQFLDGYTEKVRQILKDNNMAVVE